MKGNRGAFNIMEKFAAGVCYLTTNYYLLAIYRSLLSSCLPFFLSASQTNVFEPRVALDLPITQILVVDLVCVAIC